MIEEIQPNLHRIEVPLPNSPLRSINSYVIRGRDRTLVVDTGMNRPECEEALRRGLDELGVDLSATDLFITHLHADHMGLAGELASAGSTVYFNRPDGAMIDAARHDPGAFVTWAVERAKRGGFPGREAEESLRRHPGLRYSPERYPEFHLLDDGDMLEVGEFRLQVVATPGHTPGHLCLYETERKILLSGDHVLGDITPNITVWREEDDSLGNYLESLRKVAQLDVALVLPGHRSTFTDCRGRVAELEEHHRHRLAEVLEIVDGGARTVYDIASRMTWDIVADSWDNFPVVQKWFAVSEAAAHLRHLELQGAVAVDGSGSSFVFDPV